MWRSCCRCFLMSVSSYLYYYNLSLGYFNCQSPLLFSQWSYWRILGVPRLRRSIRFYSNVHCTWALVICWTTKKNWTIELVNTTTIAALTLVKKNHQKELKLRVRCWYPDSLVAQTQLHRPKQHLTRHKVLGSGGGVSKHTSHGSQHH